jgi:hypothetical protein
MYVIESQREFFIECEITARSVDEPQIYWWFKPKNSNKNGTIKILKKPSPASNNKILNKRGGGLESSKNQGKVTIVSKIFIDCPSEDNEGVYYCLAIDNSLNLYHTSQVKLNVLGKSFYVRFSCI